LTDKEKDFSQEDEWTEEESTSEADVEIEAEVEELKQKIEDMEDQSLRLQAEIQNMRRRNQKERELATRYRSQDLAKEILPVIDNLERALETEVTGEGGKNLKQGVQMVLESFYRALENVGVEEVEAEGQPFDPNFHEAYAQVPAEDGQESGVVAEVFEKGYKLHDRVLRAAKVTVTE
jgi:molecular chaperone GrpE